MSPDGPTIAGNRKKPVSLFEKLGGFFIVISVSVELALHKWSAPKKNRDPNIPQIAVDIRGHSVDDLQTHTAGPIS